MRAAPPTSASPMRVALTVLLDGVKGSRRLFRHLAAIERALDRQSGDGRFLFDMPSDALKIVLRQLESLIGTAQPDTDLRELHACLIDAIKSRERHERREALRQPLSSFLVDHKLQVSEARRSEFDALHAAWSGQPAPARKRPKPA